MTSDSQKIPDPVPDEPTGVPGGSYDVDETFIEEHGGEQALKDGEKLQPGR